MKQRRLALLTLTGLALGSPLAARASEADGLAMGAAPAAREIFDLFEDLEQRRKRLDQERVELSEAKTDLAQLEATVQAKIVHLEGLLAAKEKARVELERTISEAKGAHTDETMLRLVAVSEKMPPPNAARYLTDLDEVTAARILDGMNVRKAAMVMAQMNPSKAAKLSRLSLARDPTQPPPTPRARSR